MPFFLNFGQHRVYPHPSPQLGASMSYILQADLIRVIQDVNLQQIISSNQSILSGAILAAEAEAKSYLRQKYDITAEFADINTWSNIAVYKAGARVADNAGVLYYAKLPQPLFQYGGLYNIGDKVFWKDKVYTAKVQTPLLDHDTGLQYREIENIPLANPAPDDPQNGVAYWGVGVAYSVPAGTALTNTTYWTLGDSRDQQMVLYLIDITLYHVHARIAPRNIPDLRVKRYDDALGWLKMCARGEVTPALPLLQPHQGNRIRFGGGIRNINTY